MNRDELDLTALNLVCQTWDTAHPRVLHKFVMSKFSDLFTPSIFPEDALLS